MNGRRILAVGASSGIGKAFALAASAAGGLVTVSARRAAPLDEIVATMGRGFAVAGDASVPADARRIVDTAAEQMGGLDLVVYAAGYGVLQRIEECDPDVWADVYRVNVLGANLITGAALPHMHDDSICAFVSSRTVGDANAMFASYSASKAALDQCIRTWRIEHPNRRFVRVVMGNCQPTEFANHMGGDHLIGDALNAVATPRYPRRDDARRHRRTRTHGRAAGRARPPRDRQFRNRVRRPPRLTLPNATQPVRCLGDGRAYAAAVPKR